MGRAYCHTKTAATTAGGAGAGGAAAVTVTTGPPPPFGTYGGYTAAGRPITYPGGQAGAWGGGAAGGVYPQVPTTPRRSEVPNGSGPGAGNSVPRNQPIGSGADLAIVSLDASPKPKAILAGRAGSITFTASGTSNTRIRKVIFYILGESLGPASGSGPTFSKRVDIGSLGLTANTLLRAVAYDANNIKLSYATMVIPVFVLPTWVTALWPIGGTATSYTNSYSYNFKLGEGEQEGIDDDFLPIKVTISSEASLSFSLDSNSGSTSVSGEGSYSMRIESSKGDNTGSISGSLSANLDMERVPQGYYSLVLNSITIGVKGSITIAIPQLTWKYEFWIIASINIGVSIPASLEFTVTLPRHPTKKLFGIPVFISSVALGASVGVVVTAGAGIAGIKGSCTASATLAGSLTWNLPDEFLLPPPSFTLKLTCKGCIDTWFGDACKSFDVFKLTIPKRRRRELRAVPDAENMQILPLQQELDFRSAAADSLLITGLRAVPTIALVSLPGQVTMVLWRGVQNGTTQAQYASCFAGVTDGCWYSGVHRAPYLVGPATNQPVAARIGNSNVSVLVAVALTPGAAIDDMAAWTTQLLTATYDATEGIRALWTPLAPLWPAATTAYLDLRPRLSADGSLLVFQRVSAADGTHTLLHSVRAASGQWSEPIAIVASEYVLDTFRVDRAPTGEALLIYGSNDTTFTVCTMGSAGAWACQDQEPRLAVATVAAVRWSDEASAFVVAYPDLALNLAVEVLRADGSAAAPLQLLSLGYVPSVLDAAATPFGMALAWDSTSPGHVHYALVGTDGTLRHSHALAVNVSDVLGGEPVVIALAWTGDSLTVSGMSTGGPEVFPGSGYLFARHLPITADAAIGSIQFSPADFSAAPVTVTAVVANVGLMPWSGAGVSIAFTLVAANGAQTVLGSVPAPALLQSGEYANVSYVWAVAPGAAGVLRVSLSGNVDANATNDVVDALPTAISFDPASITLSAPGDRVFLIGDLTASGPGSSTISVEIWSAQNNQAHSSAVLVATVPVTVRPALATSISVALSAAQVTQIGNYLRLDALWQGALVGSQERLMGLAPYDFALDLAAIELLSVDHAHIRVGVPVLSLGLRPATHVPVTASVLNDDGSTQVLATVYLASILPGANVSVLVPFTVPTSGAIQIQFEVNPVMGGGDRLLSEVFTHDNTADRTFVTRAPADGASWSSSAAGHGAVASFSSATSPQTLGAASGGFTAGLPAGGQAAAFGDSAASSGATDVSSASSSAASSTSSEMSSASVSSGSAAYRSDSAPSGYQQSGVAPALPSSADTAATPALGPQTDILGLAPFGGLARIVLAGNPDPVTFAAIVAPDSVISRVEFLYDSDTPLASTQRTATSFLVALPAQLTGTATLEATAYSADGAQLSTLSVLVPVLTLPPWLLALRPSVTRSATDGTWSAVAAWQATVQGGVLRALSGSSLVDVAVVFADTPVDLVITVRSSGFTSIQGAGLMAVRVQQPSGALTAPATLNVTVGGLLALDDSRAQGSDVDLVLRSLTVTLSGSASFVLPELLTLARTEDVAVPVSVQLAIAPRSANVTLYTSGDATVLGGLPVALPAATPSAPAAPLDLGLSLTLTAHDNDAALTTLSAPCGVTAPVVLGAWWSPDAGFTFGPAATALSLVCALCVDSVAGTGRQCTDSAPLLTWSLLRPAPALPPLAPWAPFAAPARPADAAVRDAPTAASRYRYRVATAAPSSRVRIAQAEAADMLVWSDVDSAASSQLYFAFRPRAASWPATPPTALAAAGPLVQHTLAPLAHGAFLLVAVSASGLVQTTFDPQTGTWAPLAPVFAAAALGDAVDSAPELSADGRLLVFTRHSDAAGYTQLLSAERFGAAQGALKWRVPKTVVFDASRVAAFAVAAKAAGADVSSAMLAYQTFGSPALSLCTYAADTWRCTATARAASRPALAWNGIDFVLLYSAAGALIADRLADDGSTISSSSAPIAPSACTTAEAVDLSAVRATIAGGHSVLAAWRANSTFYVALVTSDGRLTITERSVALSAAPKPASFALAWTSAGLVAAVALPDSSVGVHVLPYTAKLALRAVSVAPSGPLNPGANVTVTLTNVGAATYDPTEEGAESALRLAVRDGQTAEYTEVGAAPLIGAIPSGMTVNASVLLSSALPAGLAGALTANIGASGDGSVSTPLCAVALSNAAVAPFASGLLAKATLTAQGQCNFRVRLSAWSAASVGGAPVRIGDVWIPLEPNFNSVVSVHLVALWHLGASLELRVSTEDAGEPFVRDTVSVSDSVDLATVPYDFRVVGALVDTAVDYAASNADTARLIASVAVLNYGARLADNVTVDAQTQAADGTWRTVATGTLGTGSMGARTRASLSFALPIGVPSQAVRYRVNMDGRYPETLWFDNVATRVVHLTPLATEQPATHAPRPSPVSPESHSRRPLSNAALAGVSLAGAVMGALLGAAVYVVWRRRFAAPTPPKVQGAYVNMQ